MKMKILMFLILHWQMTRQDKTRKNLYLYLRLLLTTELSRHCEYKRDTECAVRPLSTKRNPMSV